MGCFGTSGFLSRLPILSGQRVVCFIASVHSDVDIRMTFYPDSLVSPYCLPIHGKYDDYGCLEDVVRDANVEVIEKYFGCDIEKVLRGVERLLYGKTIKENIKYWPKTDDEWHKEEAEQYKNIVPLENGFDDYGFHKNRKYQWILLFEHEDIYNRAAEMYSGIKLQDHCKDAVDMFIDVTKRYKELYDNFKNSDAYDAKFEKFFLNNMTNMFKPRYCGLDMYLLDDYLEDLSNGNIDDTKKAEIKKILDISHKISEICNDSKHHLLCLNHEGTSDAFMAIFKQVDIDARFRLYLECEDEIRKFYSIWWFCNSIPMHFGLSHTGSQQYDADDFKKFNSIINDVIDNEFENDYPSKETSETYFLIGHEIEGGKDEFQRNTLGGGYTFSPAIDGETCYWRTRDEAYEEIDRLKAKGDKNCLMWKITKSTKITPIDY